jgi:hypothetical protein
MHIWSLFEEAEFYDFASSWTSSPPAPRQVPHWSHQHTSSAKNSWGSYLNHYSPVSCSSSGVNVWPLRAFFNGPKMRKLHGNKSRLYAGCLCTSHYMVFSSEICGPHRDGHCPAAGWRHVITKLTWTFILDLGMMILKYLTNGLQWSCC